jgi:hypothetical protein
MASGGIHEMDFPERSKMKTPKGFGISFVPFWGFNAK